MGRGLGHTSLVEGFVVVGFLIWSVKHDAFRMYIAMMELLLLGMAFKQRVYCDL
jgi:hypothetical protein